LTKIVLTQEISPDRVEIEGNAVGPVNFHKKEAARTPLHDSTEFERNAKE